MTHHATSHHTALHCGHQFMDIIWSHNDSCVLLQMPGTERKDLLQLMTAKGLHTRTDTYEILLKTAASAP